MEEEKVVSVRLQSTELFYSRGHGNGEWPKTFV